MGKVKTAYNKKNAQKYDEQRLSSKQGQLLDELERRELERAIKLLNSSDKILEVGCGTGRFTIPLAKRGFNIVGYDPSPHMVKQAREKVENYSNISFKIGEGKSLDFEANLFDLVYSIRVLNHVESKEYAFLMISEMIRVAKPGGLILIEFANVERPFSRDIYPNKTRLSFSELIDFTNKNNTDVVSKRGAFVFSMGLIENKLPGFMVPFWGILEKVTSLIFWKQCSRGYLLLRKREF